MEMIFATLLLAAGLAIAVAVIAQITSSASRTKINPFDFFGYFAIQSNVTAAVALLASVVFIFRGASQPAWVIYLRAIATAFMVIVELVYNTFLAGADLAGSFNVPWSNNILHIIVPIYILLDWVLFADQDRLSCNRLWLLLIYPIV